MHSKWLVSSTIPTTHGQRNRASHIISGLSPSLTIISMRSSRQASTSLQQICTRPDIKTPVQCHRCLYLKQPGKSLTKVLESMRYLVLVLQEIVVQPLHTALHVSSPRASWPAWSWCRGRRWPRYATSWCCRPPPSTAPQPPWWWPRRSPGRPQPRATPAAWFIMLWTTRITMAKNVVLLEMFCITKTMQITDNKYIYTT